MREQIKQQAPQSRCYLCGRFEIVAVCHHCGRGICADHLEEGEAPKWFFIMQDEFHKVDVETWAKGGIAIHCKQHLHYRVRLMRYLIYGCFFLTLLAYPTLTAPNGFDLATQTLVATLLGMLMISILMIGLPIQLWFQYKSKKHHLPPLPLFGRDRTVRVVEKLKGDLTLNADGVYQATVAVTDSFVEAKLKLTQRDFARLALYQKRHSRDPHKFHAGFVVLRGEAQISPLQGVDRPINQTPTRYPFLRAGANTMELSDKFAQLPFFQTEAAAPNRRALKMMFGYRLRAPEKLKLPIQIIPFITQIGEYNVLELQVQVLPSLSRKKLGGAKVTVDMLRIMISTDVATMSFCEPSAQTSIQPYQDREQLVMTWYRVGLQNFENGIIARKFQILFENNSQEALGQIELKGIATIQIDKLLSGVEAAHSFYPLGQAHEAKAQPRMSTEVQIGFTLNLNSLSFQRTIDFTDTHTEPGIYADYKLITAFVAQLSEKMYVKRVVENPIQHDAYDAYRLTHYWDIAGRAYHGVYGVNCHIVVMGETLEDLTTRKRGASTRLEVTVHGNVTNEALKDFMEETLCAIIAAFKETVRRDYWPRYGQSTPSFLPQSDE